MGKTSYAIRIQDLVIKHDLEKIDLAEKTFPTTYTLRSIKPRHGLTGLVSKQDSTKTQSGVTAKTYIYQHYKHMGCRQKNKLDAHLSFQH